jgi:hypothetical protein
MTDLERLEAMVRWSGQLFELRLHQVRLEQPEASTAELYAQWTDRMYRGAVPDDLLERTMEEIRRRGDGGLPSTRGQ